MTTNNANNAYVTLRSIVSSDDAYDLIAARLDNDDDTIDSIDDSPRVRALLDTIVTDRPFATSIINNDDLL